MLLPVHQRLLLVRESAPQQEDHALLRKIKDQTTKFRLQNLLTLYKDQRSKYKDQLTVSLLTTDMILSVSVYQPNLECEFASCALQETTDFSNFLDFMAGIQKFKIQLRLPYCEGGVEHEDTLVRPALEETVVRRL